MQTPVGVRLIFLVHDGENCSATSKNDSEYNSDTPPPKLGMTPHLLSWAWWVEHAFNPSTWGTEAWGALNLRTAWSTGQIPKNSQAYTEQLCLEK